MQLSPGIQDRLYSGSEEDIVHIADLVSTELHTFRDKYQMFKQLQRGANGARSDDTKSLKGAILEWITPKGQSLTPPLSRNVKINRGFQHERTGYLLCPTGYRWDDAEYVENSY